ncbi:MAG: PTS sugar transporter subunit IIA [Lentisphaeria bacterium]|nr:PTS sugar transporter subunit IIA [Lentisphaeria bacterium]
MASKKSKLSSLFSARQIVCDSKSEDRDSAIHEILTRMALEVGIGNMEHAYQEVIAREEIQSTILSPGLAVPHARLEEIEELKIGFVTSRAGIPFGGDDPVHLMVLMLAPKSKPASYLQAVSSLAHLCSHDGFISNLSELTSSEDIWRFIDREGVILPDFVCAGDIMRRDILSLRETDTLAKAIDTLVEQDLMDLPVTDAEGELVGAVTISELMRVCLPDYILWMEDLSPIINFEPFAQVLHNEGKTWLQEIMTHDYPTIAEEAPAIQVAKEITRRGAREAYVVREKKLVGKITILDFVNKILRD